MSVNDENFRMAVEGRCCRVGVQRAKSPGEFDLGFWLQTRLIPEEDHLMISQSLPNGVELIAVHGGEIDACDLGTDGGCEWGNLDCHNGGLH